MLTWLISGGGVADRLQVALTDQSNVSFVLDGQNQTITIEQIRDFQKQITLSTKEGIKHYILEAQNLSLPAQHALLKTLEEPQNSLQIILTVDREASLLPTILSRCQLRHLTQPLPSLDSVTTQNLHQLLQSAVKSSPGQLFNLAQNLSQNQPETTLSQLQLLLKQSLTTKPNLKRTQAIRLTTTCLSDLKNNLNPLLSLEHYLVELHSLML